MKACCSYDSHVEDKWKCALKEVTTNLKQKMWTERSCERDGCVVKLKPTGGMTNRQQTERERERERERENDRKHDLCSRTNGEAL
jgi:hypothetical protein